MSRSVYTASSSVDENAAMRWWGRFLMNPTVSVSSTLLPPGSVKRRVVGSRVLKSLSSAGMPASVSLFMRLDFPALV